MIYYTQKNIYESIQLGNKMTPEIIEKFKAYYVKLKMDDINDLKEVYADDIDFKDPIHQIVGIERLHEYFLGMDGNVLEGTFDFTEETIVGSKAYMTWDMDLTMKKPAKRIQVSGITVLEFDEKITKHVDYFDAGAMFYENVPILAGIIRFVKKKIAE